MAEINNKVLFDPGREDRSNEHVQSKRRSSKVWLIAVAIVVAATVAGVNVLTYYSNKNSEKTNDLTSQSLIEYEVSKKSIEDKVIRTATIRSSDKEEYEFVEGVEFEEVFFKNGDKVRKGYVIGTADLVTLAASMENTRKMIWIRTLRQK